MFPNREAPKMRDVLRGIGVWTGLTMAVAGWILNEASGGNAGSTMLFLGAFQAGMGAMANAWQQARDAETAGEGQPPTR